MDGGEPEEDAGPSNEEDAGEEDGPDAGTPDASEPELDASVPGIDAAQRDAGDSAVAATDAAVHADASPEAGTCPSGQTADACGDCGGDGSRCRHALAGHYAARTQFYAHQGANVASESPDASPDAAPALDTISKGSVISVIDVSSAGVLTEHYCFIELVSPDGLFVWSPASAVQKVPDTSVALQPRGDRYVRPLAQHHAYFGWSPQAGPTDCVTGSRDALPTSPDDCRLVDLDDDDAPGGSMYLDFGQHVDPNGVSLQLKLDVVALLSVELSLTAPASGHVLGNIAGGLQQTVLGMEGALSNSLQDLENTMCDTALGHVELVRGDYTCSSILAGRKADIVGYGVFDESLDPPAPTLETCEAPPGS